VGMLAGVEFLWMGFCRDFVFRFLFSTLYGEILRVVCKGSTWRVFCWDIPGIVCVWGFKGSVCGLVCGCVKSIVGICVTFYCILCVFFKIFSGCCGGLMWGELWLDSSSVFVREE